MKKLYNIKQIVRVSIHDKEESEYFKYHPLRKYWWRPNKPEGWYRDDFGLISDSWSLITEDKIDNNLLVIDKVCYVKPYVRITFSNGDSKSIDFNTIENCKTYMYKLELKSNKELIDLNHL
jgi:hypothetical protein